MVASQLGFEDDGLASADHHGPEDHGEASPVGAEDVSPADEFVHPWAREMMRRGLSFNGSERNKLFRGLGGGRFADISALSGGDTPLDGRAVLAGDLDLDGDMDLFVHSLQRGRHSLFRNELDPREGDWLALRLAGPGEGIGATVEVLPVGEEATPSQAQVLSRGSGFASCQAPELLFACPTGGAQVRVRWPGGGGAEDFGPLTGGRYLLQRGAGTSVRMEPTGPAGGLPDPLPPGLKLAPGEFVQAFMALDPETGSTIQVDPAAAEEGERTLLAFWGSFCAPCVREIPELERLHQKPGIKVIGISVDAGGQHKRAQDLLRSAGASYPGYFLPVEEAASEGLDELVDLMRLPIPTILELDHRGRLLHVLHGL